MKVNVQTIQSTVRMAITAGACAVSLFVGPNMVGLHIGEHSKTRHALAGVKAAAPELLKPAAKLAAEVRARQKLLQSPHTHASKAVGLHIPPPSLDKQPVRDWLEGTGWGKTPPPPALPAEVVSATRDRYVQAYERLSGLSFATWPGVGAGS